MRLYFGLPLEYVTLENSQKLWKIMKKHLRIQEDYMVQMNHDMILKCIKAYFSTVKHHGTETINQETSNNNSLFILLILF